MLKTTVVLLSIMVAISAIGLGLYANELSRQARLRREAEGKAREEAREARLHDLYQSLNMNEKFLRTFCHPGNEKIAPDSNAKPGTAAWDKWQCDFGQAHRRDLEREISRMKASR